MSDRPDFTITHQTALPKGWVYANSREAIFAPTGAEVVTNPSAYMADNADWDHRVVICGDPLDFMRRFSAAYFGEVPHGH